MKLLAESAQRFTSNCSNKISDNLLTHQLEFSLTQEKNFCPISIHIYPIVYDKPSKVDEFVKTMESSLCMIHICYVH